MLSITGTLASTIGQINPFRYRGYYYDTETGFFYLQSRYYDPVVGRFLNADGIIGANGGILGYNMFAYCGNNPIVRVDRDGYFWEIVVVLAIAIGGTLTLSSCSDPDMFMEGTPLDENLGPITTRYSTYGSAVDAAFEAVEYAYNEQLKDGNSWEHESIIYDYGGY